MRRIVNHLALAILCSYGCAPDPSWIRQTLDAEDASVEDAPADTPPSDSAPDVPRDAPPDAPDAAPRTTFPPLRVFVSPTWTEAQRRGIWSGLGLLREVLPVVIEVPSEAAADVGVYPSMSQDCSVAAGDTYTRTAYADPRCFPTAAGFDFPHAIAHLILHHTGMRHVCAGPGEGTDCSPVPFGRGLLNVHFAEERTAARTRLGWTDALSPSDLAEARRVLTAEGWRFP